MHSPQTSGLRTDPSLTDLYAPALARARFPESTDASEILTPAAVQFLINLHDRFEPVRQDLLARREQRQREIDAGKLPGFLEETRAIRESEWRVAPAPHDLEDRRVEITGPAESKMMINALNSGARVFMADIEDSLSPTWENVIAAQDCIRRAVNRTLSFQSADGKAYLLNESTATLVVRPRGWHLNEAHFTVDGKSMSASLFDFGLCFFHNAHEMIARGSGPYYYLPKMESHLEARLWNDVFNFAQDERRILRGTIRATVLIETILAAFEMDEILFELKDHASGLNAGRWDYIFSVIKKFSGRADFILPDRARVTMAVPFMRSYAQLLVKTCHRRGAHAMGGMSAFIPSRKDREVNERALAKVREDKEREAGDGFDGTWVAHPDLVGIAAEIFERKFEGRPHQKHVLREDVRVNERDLLEVMPGSKILGEISEAGLRTNIEIAIHYIERWISGQGAVAIHNLMEDAATAEISRVQVWQWIHHGLKLEDGRKVTLELCQQLAREELEGLKSSLSVNAPRLDEAAEIFLSLISGAERPQARLPEFLTLAAYQRLVRPL